MENQKTGVHAWPLLFESPYLSWLVISVVSGKTVVTSAHSLCHCPACLGFPRGVICISLEYEGIEKTLETQVISVLTLQLGVT